MQNSGKFFWKHASCSEEAEGESQAMSTLKVIPLGTSSAVPTPERNVSALAVQLETHWILFDCGEGTQYRLLRAPLRPGKLRAIFISHLHGDHVFGLPGLLSTMGMQNRTAPLQILGPPGIRSFVDATLTAASAYPSYPIQVRELESGECLDMKAYTVTCLSLDHTVNVYGYSLIERNPLPRLDPEKAKELGVPPGPLYRALQQGESVRLPDGRTVDSSEVTGPQRKGRKVTFCTDTRPCAASIKLARDADLLIHEATYSHELREKAREHGHSTSLEAARIAREADVKRLLITHFSARYTRVDSLLEEARSVFPNTEAAQDLEELTVG